MSEKRGGRFEKRKRAFIKTEEYYLSQGYRRKDLSLDTKTANLTAMITALPPVLFFLLLFGLVVGWDKLLTAQIWIVMIAMLISLVVHELIHGFFFGLFAEHHYSAVEFGVLWKSLNPYCYCSDPLTKWQYMTALLAPGIILGVCTGIVSIMTRSATCLFFSILSLFGASGDFLVAFKLMHFSVKGKEAKFLDHPEKPGLIVYVKEKESPEKSCDQSQAK